jgi:hypothetical protein
MALRADDPKLKPTFLKIKNDYLNKQTRTDIHKQTKTKQMFVSVRFETSK